MLEIDREKCCGCNYCSTACAQEALSYTEYIIEVDPEKCELCGACVYFCPIRAIQVIREE